MLFKIFAPTSSCHLQYFIYCKIKSSFLVSNYPYFPDIELVKISKIFEFALDSNPINNLQFMQ